MEAHQNPSLEQTVTQVQEQAKYLRSGGHSTEIASMSQPNLGPI